MPATFTPNAPDLAVPVIGSSAMCGVGKVGRALAAAKAA